MENDKIGTYVILLNKENLTPEEHVKYLTECMCFWFNYGSAEDFRKIVSNQKTDYMLWLYNELKADNRVR